MQDKILVFDLDGTLYYAGDEIEKRCDAKILAFFEKRLHLNRAEAVATIKKIRQKYTYETSVMETELPFTKKEFLDEICDVDVSVLKTDETLNHILHSLPQRKFILTDSIAKHVSDVLRTIKVDKNLFEGIFDAHDMNYTFKYNPESYKKFLQKFALQAENCIMFEDNPVNLKVAKNLGFATILILPERPSGENVADLWFPDIKTALRHISG